MIPLALALLITTMPVPVNSISAYKNIQVPVIMKKEHININSQFRAALQQALSSYYAEKTIAISA